MLGQMIGVEPGLIVRLDQLQPVLVQLAEGEAAPVHVVENAELDLHGIVLQFFVA